MTVYRLIPFAFLALVACQEDGPDLTTCGADTLQDLVGQSPEMMGMMAFPEGTRMLGPDSAATTDYLPERLNMSYDEDGVVTRVWCG